LIFLVISVKNETMKKVCAVSGVEFEITEEDLKFYEKMGVPAPTLCPEERQRKKYAWRNEKGLCKRKCDFTGNDIISMYSSKSPFKIYSQDIWWSDKWNALDFGKNFDFSQSFFEQFRELQLKTPRLSLVNKNSENCQYTNHSANNKNCYVASVTFDSEDIYYSDWIVEHCVDCVDCSYLFDGSQLCYEVYYGWNAYESCFCELIRRCRDMWFCYDCIACEHCFMCSTLRNKKFCIKNKQYSEGDYKKIINDIFPLTYVSLEKFKALFIDLKKDSIHRSNYCLQTEDSSGDFLFNTKNCHHSFDCLDMEDSSYCIDVTGLKDSRDAYHIGWSQLVYESHAIANSFEALFCHFSYDNKNITYCDSVHNSNDLFGCVGLNHKQYCILNKQYSKEEYFKLRDKIIEHMSTERRSASGGIIAPEWGEFFPIELSPFAYNETVAQEYFPMTKEEVLARGWKWRNDDVQTLHATSVPTDKIPDNIADVPDSICTEILACETCGKNYKIQKSELKFYRKMNLPIPHKCPDCRHTNRMKLRNPRKLFSRTCDKCGIEIQTTFAPERPEKVYCEKCYLDAVE
jgi:CxxC-x17-CxxC domain-containing protein